MVQDTWASPDGLALITTILKSSIPQWPAGPRDWQVEATAHILDNRNELVIAGCGEGKTAVMYLHILVRRHLRDNPQIPRRGLALQDSPVVLTVTPLTDLADSQVAEMTRLGISAISLDSERVTAARDRGIDLFDNVKQCEWSVILTSPERLNSPPFDHILRHQGFISNLLLYCADEAHIAYPWSKAFRLAYGQINRVVARIPPRVPVLLMSATFTLEAEKTLLRLMGFRVGAYHTIRRPIERPNMRIVFKTLHTGLGGDEFPDIAWVAVCGKKILVFSKDFDLCWRVVSYLQWLLPVETRQRNIRMYNGLTDDSNLRGRERAEVLRENAQTIDDFCNDPETYVVVATIKFGMGVDMRRVDISINIGLPETPENTLQQNCRGGRDPTRVGVGMTYVEMSYVQRVREEYERAHADSDEDSVDDVLAAPAQVSHPRSSRTSAPVHTGPGDKGKVSDPLESEDLRRLILCHAVGFCLVAEFNRLFSGPSPSSHELASCLTAKRRLPCSSCIRRLPPSHPDRPPFRLVQAAPQPTTQTEEAPPASPAESTDDETDENITDDETALPVTKKRAKLTKKMEGEARRRIDEWSMRTWASKSGLRAQFLPYTIFIPDDILQALIAEFHLIRDREELARVLFNWEWLMEHERDLFALINELNSQFDEERRVANAIRAEKARLTREKKAQKTQKKAAQHNILRENARPSSSRTPLSPPKAPAARRGVHRTENIAPHAVEPSSPRRKRALSVATVASPSRRTKQRRL